MNSLLRKLQGKLPVAFLLVLAACLSSGCSGINASKSVSPLDFLLPGLGGLGRFGSNDAPVSPIDVPAHSTFVVSGAKAANLPAGQCPGIPAPM